MGVPTVEKFRSLRPDIEPSARQGKSFRGSGASLDIAREIAVLYFFCLGIMRYAIIRFPRRGFSSPSFFFCRMRRDSPEDFLIRIRGVGPSAVADPQAFIPFF